MWLWECNEYVYDSDDDNQVGSASCSESANEIEFQTSRHPICKDEGVGLPYPSL